MIYCTGSFNGHHQKHGLKPDDPQTGLRTAVMVLFGLSLCGDCAKRATDFITADFLYRSDSTKTGDYSERLYLVLYEPVT